MLTKRSEASADENGSRQEPITSLGDNRRETMETRLPSCRVCTDKNIKGSINLKLTRYHFLTTNPLFPWEEHSDLCFDQQHFHMMAEETALLSMVDTHAHLVEGTVVVSADRLVLLDMGNMIPQRVVAGFPGKVPVDMRAFVRNAVEIRRYLQDTE